ncbi:hypothetical protein BX257_4010 [Streptomyces sp. 3212.3]|uniref:hypothetical protein n=1 Tax=Streptomyces sp. 3212.3 TaxID=1938846 RepID=UPI000E267DB2|nr:hypothetical protein [Streptomyces sp. 3212.3]REE61432.1 hypothetical protein BX257_4010 [Streptomyces sp. 3212.3]
MSQPLTHKGRPVPYITAWSREIVAQPNVMATAGGLAYAGTAPGRDPDGVLWQVWARRPGSGEPVWNRVHGLRQRQAMRKFLCQVCGGPADRNEQGWLWLLEDQRDEERREWPDGWMTVHPPVCRSCLVVATRLCPHLRRGVVPVRVGEVILDGVYGQRYRVGPLGLLGGERDTLLMGDWQSRWMVGGQLAASLDRCTVLDPAEFGIEQPAARRAAAAP